MNALLAVFSAHRISKRRAWKDESRVRIAWFIRTAILIGMGYWLVLRWTESFSQWQQLDPKVLELRLWLLVINLSFPFLGLAALTAFQYGFSKDEPILLMTLPIPEAVRYRTLVSLIFLEGMGRWFLLGNLTLGTALALTLGWQGVPWLVLSLAAMMTATWLGVSLAPVLVLLSLRKLRNLRSILLTAALTLTGFGATVATAVWLGTSGHLLGVPLPCVIAFLMLAATGLLIGPFAAIIGAQYARAFRELQAYARPNGAFRLLGSRYIARWLSRKRNMYGALLFKGFLNQSRNPIALLRVGVLVLSLLVFPILAKEVGELPFSRVLLVAGYTLLVVSVTLNETIVNAVSGEGERLTLYLVTQTRVEDYLKARFLVLLGPVLFGGLVHTLITSRLNFLTWSETVLALAVVLLGLVGSTGLLVWGGTSDLDIAATVEGSAQTLLQEDAPVEPRRFMLLNFSILFFVMVVVLVAWLPVLVAQAALVFLDLVILRLTYRYGRARIHRLLTRS